MPLQTEFEFTLPMGYIDEKGDLHKTGVMRLASAADEVLPMRDPRVQQNPAYLNILVLSRVVNKLGALSQVGPGIIENLFITDYNFLQAFYEQINGNGTYMMNAICPKCRYAYQVDISKPGENDGINHISNNREKKLSVGNQIY